MILAGNNGLLVNLDSTDFLGFIRLLDYTGFMVSTGFVGFTGLLGSTGFLILYPWCKP